MTQDKAKLDGYKPDLQDACLLVAVLCIVGGVAVHSRAAAAIVFGALLLVGVLFDAWLKAKGL